MTREHTIMIVAAILRLRGGIDHIVEAREIADQIEPPRPAGKYRYCLDPKRYGLDSLPPGTKKPVTKYCALPPNHSGRHHHLREDELL